MLQNAKFQGKTGKIVIVVAMIGLIFIQNALLFATSPQSLMSDTLNGPGTSPRAAATREEMHPEHKELVNDSTFVRPVSPWNVTYESDSSEADMRGNIVGNQANTTIIGNQSEFKFYENPTSPTGWTEMPNPSYIAPLYPDTHTIDGSGCYVSHYWAEGANQAPSVWWVKDVAAPVNTSDYKIISANVSGMISAIVNTNIDVVNYS